MALQGDRVKETTTVTGTGTATLLGAATNFRAFSAKYTNATTTDVPYVIVDNTNNTWEVGMGTYTLSGTTLSRDVVLNSSNAGALVNFAAATKDVFVTIPEMNANLSITQNTSSKDIVIPVNCSMLVVRSLAVTGTAKLYNRGTIRIIN